MTMSIFLSLHAHMQPFFDNKKGALNSFLANHYFTADQVRTHCIV